MEVGDVIRVAARMCVPQGFPSHRGGTGGIGEICALFEDRRGKRMLWRRLLTIAELPDVPDAHGRELVETTVLVELPVAAISALQKVTVVSAEAGLEGASRNSDALDMFCRRSICSAGSGVLWDVAWDEVSRAKRRAAAVAEAWQLSVESPPRRAPAGLEEDEELGSRNCLVHAVAALRLDAGTRLPGREPEQNEIMSFLSEAIQGSGSSQVQYISGMPGTGKTASVLEALRKFKLSPGHEFSFVHVNAMSLSHPGAVFADICRKVLGVDFAARCRSGVPTPFDEPSLGETQAFAALARFFSRRSPADVPIILLLDEVDCLVTPAQTVLYRLFDWLSRPCARLAVLAVSNTLDLPERLLPRVASRGGFLRRLDFGPYSRQQLRAILDDRLQGAGASSAFCAEALELVAARVAAGSGDARKALQVCRFAAEAAHGGRVTVQGLAAAEAALLRANPAAAAIARLGGKARLLLLALLLEKRLAARMRPGGGPGGGPEAVRLRSVARRYGQLAALCARRAGLEPTEAPCAEEAAFTVRRLEAMAILRSSSAVDCAGLELGESLDVDDVADALRSHPDGHLARELLS